jgi:competence protein ComEA
MKKLIPTLIVAASLGFAFTPSVHSAEEKAESSLSTSQSSLIDINTATPIQLQSLPGIGKKKAQAIVDYRTENGRFLNINELTNVKGIGKKMVSKLAQKVSAS